MKFLLALVWALVMLCLAAFVFVCSIVFFPLMVILMPLSIVIAFAGAWPLSVVLENFHFRNIDD